MTKPFTAKEAVLSVRIPLAIKKWLERRAQRNRVSQNSEIIHALRDRMDAERREAASTTSAPSQ
jgi:hypothetical protein